MLWAEIWIPDKKPVIFVENGPRIDAEVYQRKILYLKQCQDPSKTKGARQR